MIAITLGIKDIYYRSNGRFFDGTTMSIQGDNVESMKTIVEELEHTRQFLLLWSHLPTDKGNLTYDQAKSAWEIEYGIQTAKVGFSYKNEVETQAKSERDEVMKRIEADFKTTTPCNGH